MGSRTPGCFLTTGFPPAAGTLLPGGERQRVQLLPGPAETDETPGRRYWRTTGEAGGRSGTPGRSRDRADLRRPQGDGPPIDSGPSRIGGPVSATPGPRAGARSTDDEGQRHGQHLEVAERQVPAAVPGRARQGARPSLRPQDRCAALARRGHCCRGHRHLRRPGRGSADLRRVLRRVVGPPGVGARHRDGDEPGRPVHDLRRRPDAVAASLARRALGQEHGLPRPGAGHRARPDQQRPRRPARRRRRPGHPARPERGRRPPPAVAARPPP